MKRLTAIILLFSLIFSLCACSNQSTNMYSKDFTDYFDTIITISAQDSSKESFDKKVDEIEKELDRYSKLFDIYNDYDGIENLKYVNEHASKSPIIVDPDIAQLLYFGKIAYTTSKKTVNIAMGSVLSIWHDYREEGTRIPSEKELTEANKHTDISKLIVNKSRSTVYFKDNKMSVDVGAITKGYVTEKIAQYISDNNIWTSCVLSLGGNIKVIGYKNVRDKFNIAIESPSNQSEYLETVQIANGYSVVTSGSYQRYYEVDGVQYCHIIDPNTLMPSNNFKSVSVICGDSSLADILSTALFILDLNEGMKLINNIDKAEAVWVDNNNKKYYSTSFKEYIK